VFISEAEKVYKMKLE